MVEEVDQVLTDIENRYSQVTCDSVDDDLEENLNVLSKEFDSVGVQSIDLSRHVSKVFKQVVRSARSLVQLHRQTLSQLSDVKINVQSKNCQSNNLHKIVEDYQSKVNLCEGKKGLLQNRISVLEGKLTEHRKKETELKNEIDKLKRYSSSRVNDHVLKIKRLSDENQRLKEMLKSDINTSSKDEVLLKFIGKYKHNEEVFKNTIHKLQENNRQLLEEIVDLRISQDVRRT